MSTSSLAWGQPRPRVSPARGAPLRRRTSASVSAGGGASGAGRGGAVPSCELGARGALVASSPVPVRMELGASGSWARPRDRPGNTAAERQEPRTGAEAGGPGPGAPRAPLFLRCLYLVGFLVSAAARADCSPDQVLPLEAPGLVNLRGRQVRPLSGRSG